MRGAAAAALLKGPCPGGTSRRAARSWAVRALGLALLAAWPHAGWAQASRRGAERIAFSGHETARCLTCHGMPNLGYWDAVTRRVLSFTVGPDAFRASAHGKLECQQCHADITGFPHDLAEPRAPVSCAQDCHATDSTGHAYTHARESDDFRRSAHGRHGDRPDADSLVCTSCHGGGEAHAVARAGQRVTAAQKVAVCAGCHDDRPRMERHRVAPDAVASYRRSFHSKAIVFGGGRTASCPDCHTAHRILPARDTASTVAAAHLPQTCGRKDCHAGARRNFAVSGANHLDLRVGREPLLFLEEKLFILLTLGTMAMLVAGIILDIQRKFGWLVVLASAAVRLRRAADVAARSGARALRVARFLLVE